MLRLPASARSALLSADGSGKDSGVRNAGLQYDNGPVQTQWDGVLVGEAVAAIAARDSLPHLDYEHFEVLSTALSSDDLTGSRDQKWVAVFTSLKTFIYVALCDSAVSGFAVNILRTFAVETSLGSSVFSVRVSPLS